MAQVDTDNSGVPYESPSNKGFQCDRLILADGSEVLLTKAQADVLNANGICTAMNFINGWVAWGNYTPAIPEYGCEGLLHPSQPYVWLGRQYAYQDVLGEAGQPYEYRAERFDSQFGEHLA